jgi:hypothetical protein
MLAPMRGFWLALALAAGIGFASVAYGQAGTVPSTARGELTLPEIVERDALLQPGVDAMKKDDPATALAAFPNDLKTLRYSALAALKSAKKANKPSLKAAGFLIEEFEVQGKRVQVGVFPSLAGRYHTLYRFMLVEPAKVESSASTQSGGGDRCNDPNFLPYMDVEADDVLPDGPVARGPGGPPPF